MAEYLSPGVYVEEFDSGAPPMEGVSTSTAGFIGLAQKGPVEGLPELITSFADFQRTFGSYLSQNEFGNYRFLAYAVEHFFMNGGSRCYVMRVAPPDAKTASNEENDDKNAEALKIVAKNPGSWGNKIKVSFSPSSKAKTQILALGEDPATYYVKSSAGFNVGDIVVFSDGESKQYSKVVSSQDNVIKLEKELEGGEGVIDTELLPTKTLSTSEFTVIVDYQGEVETYENVSLNVAAANHIEKVLGRSKLVDVEDLTEDGEEIISPLEQIGGEDDSTEFVVQLNGGSNGSQDSVSPADYIGEDRGPGKRTGIQAFIDNDEVSIMAVPGVTEPSVQLALVAHCENLEEEPIHISE